VSVSAQSALSSSKLTLAGRTVLVLEDDADSRDMLTAVLQSLRARVLVAITIEEAERKVSFSGVNLIICDLKLPDGTGLDFIKWLRAQSKKIRSTPCMAITAYDQHFVSDAATGFDAYMRKPINLDRFCDVAVALARP
jgi:CheY-like chemotaxis protein